MTSKGQVGVQNEAQVFVLILLNCFNIIKVDFILGFFFLFTFMSKDFLLGSGLKLIFHWNAHWLMRFKS